MLVLTRKVGEELVIGDNVRVVVNRVSGNRVTIGVEAPEEVRIVRGELKAIVESFDDHDLPPAPEAPTSPIPADFDLPTFVPRSAH